MMTKHALDNQDPAPSAVLVTDALQSARDAVESMLALKRPDLLDPDTVRFALQRVGRRGSTGEFLQETLRKLDAAQEQLMRDASKPAQPVGFETVLRRWDVEDGSAEVLEHEPEYRVTCTPSGSQVAVDIVMSDPSLAATAGMPGLLLTVEINGGLPCVYVHGGSLESDMALSIFSNVGGAVVVTEGDAGSNCTHVKRFDPKLEQVTDLISRASAAIGSGMAPAPDGS